MVNINDWVQRTSQPLAGREPFDWHSWSIAQVAHIDDEGVHVEFACNCMTFDNSSTKMWYHGEYKSLDDQSYIANKEAHDMQCDFNKELEISI